MRLVFIADDSPANAWLIREVERQHVVQCILRPDWTAVPPRSTSASTTAAASATRPKQRASLAVPTRLRRWLRSRYFAWRDVASRARMTHALWNGAPPSPPATPIWCVSAWEINSNATVQRLRELSPDLIVASGAPILRSSVYAVPRHGTVNLHFGISPNYRGLHTVITPMQRGDYAHVGATLHCVDDGIDSGPVLLRVYPDLSSDDTPESIEARIVRDSATALAWFLSWLAARSAEEVVTGRRFAGRGELVRFHDRRIRDDLRFRLRHALGQRPPSLSGRVEIFYTG